MVSLKGEAEMGLLPSARWLLFSCKPSTGAVLVGVVEGVFLSPLLPSRCPLTGLLLSKLLLLFSELLLLLFSDDSFSCSRMRSMVLGVGGSTVFLSFNVLYFLFVDERGDLKKTTQN